MRVRVAAQSALVLLLLAPAAGAQRSHSSLGLEDAYLVALRDLAAGSPHAAVVRVIDLEEESSPECVGAIELHTAEILSTRVPEALVAQAFLRIAVRQARHHKIGPSAVLFPFEPVSIEGLRELGRAYLRVAPRRDAPSLVAGLFTYMAHGVAALRSKKRLQAGVRLLESAVELDPNHPAALHSLAVTLELLDRPAGSLRHLERLLESAPADPRLRLRRAIVTVKSGRLAEGESLLRELSAEGPDWARDLATQELARLLVAGGRREDAEALLRASLAELPEEKLRIQLAALLDPRWSESREVLEPWLSERQGDPAPSARWIYEDGATEELEVLRLELGSALSNRLDRLAEGLDRIPDLDDRFRKRLPACP